MEMSLSDLISMYERVIEDVNTLNRNVVHLEDDVFDEFLLETARTSDYYEGTLSTLHSDVAQIKNQLKILLSIDPDIHLN